MKTQDLVFKLAFDKGWRGGTKLLHCFTVNYRMHLSVHPSIHLSIIYQSIYPSIHLSTIHLSIYLAIEQSRAYRGGKSTGSYDPRSKKYFDLPEIFLGLHKYFF